MNIRTTAMTTTAQSDESLAQLKTKMDDISRAFHGTLGYSLHHRGQDEGRISFNGDETFPSASTIKTAIMCETMRQIDGGEIKWDQELSVQASMEDRQEGGFAYYFKEGTKLSICDWVHLMITISDNTATMNLREFLGQNNINDWLLSHKFSTTRLLNGKRCDELGLRSLQQKWGLGMTTPNEMVQLFELILDNKAASPAACERMQRILSHQYWDDFGLSQIPPSIHTGAKSGAIERSRADVMFVDGSAGQYILAVHTKDLQDTSWTVDNEGHMAIRKLSSLVWNYYNPKCLWAQPEGWKEFLPREEA